MASPEGVASHKISTATLNFIPELFVKCYFSHVVPSVMTATLLVLVTAGRTLDWEKSHVITLGESIISIIFILIGGGLKYWLSILVERSFLSAILK